MKLITSLLTLVAVLSLYCPAAHAGQQEATAASIVAMSTTHTHTIQNHTECSRDYTVTITYTKSDGSTASQSKDKTVGGNGSIETVEFTVPEGATGISVSVTSVKTPS